MNEESLYYYFKVKNQTKDIVVGNSLTNDELKSIDESEKLESGEDL